MWAHLEGLHAAWAAGSVRIGGAESSGARGRGRLQALKKKYSSVNFSEVAQAARFGKTGGGGGFQKTYLFYFHVFDL